MSNATRRTLAALDDFAGVHTLDEWRARMRLLGASEDELARAPTPLPVEDFVPLVLPASWVRDHRPPRATWHIAWFLQGRLCVSLAVCRYGDGKRWLHVVASRPSMLPSYDDLCAVKHIFVGAEREAYQKFPRKSEHVNTMPHALHLWSSLDGDVTPDFRIEGMI